MLAFKYESGQHHCYRHVSASMAARRIALGPLGMTP